MQRILILVILAGCCWYGYATYFRQPRSEDAAAPHFPDAVDRRSDSRAEQFSEQRSDERTEDSAAHFACDGREYCSQMTSCAEATYFLRNCPNVKMDGDGDGVPCEKQWCNQ